MRYKHLIVSVALACATASPVVAQAGAAGGGATEFTQIANNGLLASILGEQAASVVQETATAATTLKTYQMLFEDLKGLDDLLRDQMLEIFNPQIFVAATMNAWEVQSSAYALQDLFKTRQKDMLEMQMKGFDPKYYLTYEAELAKADENAALRWNKDYETLQLAEARLAGISETAKKASSITTTIQGFQSLAATSAATATEVAELNKQVAYQAQQEKMDQRIAAQWQQDALQYKKARIEASRKEVKVLGAPISGSSGYDLKYRDLSK